MSPRSDGEEEPLEGEGIISDDDTIERDYHEDVEDDSADRSTQGDSDTGLPVEPAPIPTGGVRDNLGFQRGRRALTVPNWMFLEGEVDDGTQLGLTVVDSLGVMLVSCASGEEVEPAEVSSAVYRLYEGITAKACRMSRQTR